MKKFFYLAAALAFASCSSDDFLGDKEQNANDGAIHFGFDLKGMSKADHVGADAAKLLNNKFVVVGTKGGTLNTPSSVVTAQTVFDHYNVEWAENTAGTTASNTSDWEYVDKAKSEWNTSITGDNKQEIKYWDYSVGQYDFIAYSYSDATCTKYNSTFPTDGQLAVTAVTPASATAKTTGAYTVYGNTTALDKFYIADLVTAYNPDYTSKPTGGATMGNEVQLTFRKLTSKVRLAFYETVPGYSIRNVEFYASDDATVKVADDYATLYSGSSNIYSKGAYTVYFPTVNNSTPTSDYNKAHVSFQAESTGSATTFTTGTKVNATREQASTKETAGTNVYLNTSSNQPSYCGTGTAVDTKGEYTVVLPNEEATALTLRVNYTLVSNDGSKETIKVWGAKAVVPAEYCQWKSNYAYTYIFKISDNTNGLTDKLNGTHAGLTPITFDAVVVDDEEHTQQTITTVATPSITTYQNGRVITTDEYDNTKGDIYVTVQDQEHAGAILNNLSGKDELYVVTGATTAVPATEANVMDALNMGTVDGSGNVTGRNGLVLTKGSLAATVSDIPSADGNAITQVTVWQTDKNAKVAVSNNNVAKFTPAASKTYAYVYQVKDADDTEYYSAITVDANAEISANTYYEMQPDGTYTVVSAGTNGSEAKIYYKKYTNNNTTYAVKVIKVQ